MENSVFNAGAYKTQGGPSPPSSSGPRWDPRAAVGAVNQLGGVIGSALRAFGGNGGGGGGGYRSPNYLAQAINEHYRPGPEPKEPKSIWPSLGESARQAQQANAAAEREAQRLAVRLADGRKAMEAVSKLAAERRAAAQGIGVVALPNNPPAAGENTPTFNLIVPPSTTFNVGISGWFDERNAIQHQRMKAVEEARNPMPLPKSKQQLSLERQQALHRVLNDAYVPKEGGVGEFNVFFRSRAKNRVSPSTKADQNYINEQYIKPRLNAMEYLPLVGTAYTVLSPYSSSLEKLLSIIPLPVSKALGLARKLPFLKLGKKVTLPPQKRRLIEKRLLEKFKIKNKRQKFYDDIEEAMRRIPDDTPPIQKTVPTPPRLRTVGKRERVWSNTKEYSSQQNFKNHYETHVLEKKEFPEIKTELDYFNKAWGILEKPSEGALFKRLANGQQCLYLPNENTIIFTTKDGVLQSMYRPVKGMEWFLKQ
jgi:hypothetical protein